MTETEPRITVALLDDHPAIARAITEELKGAQFHVVIDERTRETFVAAMQAYPSRTGSPVDIALIDYNLGTTAADGKEMVRSLVHTFANTRFVVYTSETGAHFKSQVISAGARGFIGKSVPLKRIPEHILAVVRNRVVVDPPLDLPRGLPRGSRIDLRGVDSLTEKQVDIARLLLRDMSPSDIADKLCRTRSTVSSHARDIYDKLGVRGRWQFLDEKDEWLERLDSLHGQPRDD